ncbi:MAG: hypothetical protein Q4E33_03755 [Erysipelotrichaceae bacterium]|nr:hypothetical protein [Erysipelotrichaceae bacterium]
MEKLSGVAEALAYLKQGDIITSNGKDQFILRDKKICRYDNGSYFAVDINDFLDLYKSSNFFLYEDSVYIDEEKDEAYYRYYRK